MGYWEQVLGAESQYSLVSHNCLDLTFAPYIMYGHRHVSLVLMVPFIFEHVGQLVVSVEVQDVQGTAN